MSKEWKINRRRVDYGKPYKIVIYDDSNRRIALVYKEGNDVYLKENMADANAELIVRAVNSHDKLVEASEKILTAMEQKQFFMNGYANGSASISEVNQASVEEHKAYCILFDLIKEIKKP